MQVSKCVNKGNSGYCNGAEQQPVKAAAAVSVMVQSSSQ